MAESVTVDQGSTSITTNTMSEAELRTEMQAPEPSASAVQTDADHPAPPAPPVRDDKGRFAPKTEPALPLEAPLNGLDSAPVTAEPPARRRDDTLPRHDPMARMKQALAQKAEAERRAQALEAELTRLRTPAMTSPVTPAPVQPTNGHPAQGEPQFEQFANEADPYTAYMQAWARWDRAQGIAEARQAWDSELSAKERAKEFTSRLQTGKKEYADFDQVLTEADTLGLQVSAVMQEAIAASPHAADLVYFLATHPEECTQLAEESQYTPVAAATVMRRLLESHLAPRAAPRNGSGPAARAPVSTAKPPVTPVGSSPVVGDEPPGDSASAADHARYWNRRLKVPGTR